MTTSSSWLALGPSNAGPLHAGGSLPAPAPTGARRLWLAAEMTTLFAGAPIVMHQAVHGGRLPLFLALIPVLLVALSLLAADRSFQLRHELSKGFSGRALVSMVILAAFGAAAMSAFVLNQHPHWFMEFAVNRPETYKRIMLLYPLASVAAQELVYRTFFFHRYGPLFGEHRWLAIVLNGLLFGFAHIVVGTPFAILGTCLTGLLFAARYAATRSYWAVLIEHTIWGWLVFTIGLGRYFFTGIANVG